MVIPGANMDILLPENKANECLVITSTSANENKWITGRSSRPEVFTEKGVLKKCNKFTGEDPCRSMISVKLLCSFIEITLRHECSLVNFYACLKKIAQYQTQCQGSVMK